MTHHLATTTRTDLDRVEDIAALALAAGRRAARGLHGLPVCTTRRSVNLDWVRRTLTSGRLIDEAALDALGDLEAELHRLVEAEAFYTLGDYDEGDAMYHDRAPERRLTKDGRRVERVRHDLVDAIEHAQRVLGLLQAEKIVGRRRGFGG